MGLNFSSVGKDGLTSHGQETRAGLTNIGVGIALGLIVGLIAMSVAIVFAAKIYSGTSSTRDDVPVHPHSIAAAPKTSGPPSKGSQHPAPRAQKAS